MILPNYFRNTHPWFSEFDRLFDHAVRQSRHPFRVFQNEAGWTLELDQPGVAKEDLELKVEERELRLETKNEDSNAPGYRLPLGKHIDANGVKAKLSSGVLTVELPRIQPDQKTIEIL